MARCAAAERRPGAEAARAIAIDPGVEDRAQSVGARDGRHRDHPRVEPLALFGLKPRVGARIDASAIPVLDGVLDGTPPTVGETLRHAGADAAGAAGDQRFSPLEPHRREPIREGAL